MTSSYTLEQRSKRYGGASGGGQGSDAKYERLRKLQQTPGSFYIEQINQCPLTHVAHDVGSLHKLCVPIQSETKVQPKICELGWRPSQLETHKVDLMCGTDTPTPTLVGRRESHTSRNYAQRTERPQSKSKRANPYDSQHYEFSR